MRRNNGPHIPADPLDWRPQRPFRTRVPVTVKDPIVEPLWSGERVLLHFDFHGEPGERIRLIDEVGDELTLTEPVVETELWNAITSVDAVIDGVLTHEATRPGEGIALVTESRASATSLLFSRNLDINIERKDQAEPTKLAFVAFDLLRLDGQSLLDLPLLERKRLLESVIVQSERVRVSVYARPPIGMWIVSWKAAGLRGAMMKSANSRYVPGGSSVEWRTVTKIGEPRV